MNKLNMPFESVFGSHATIQVSNLQRQMKREDRPTHHVHELLNNKAAVLADVLPALW